MTSKLLRCVFLAALAAAISGPAWAGELKLTMQNGRVTLIADNVPVRQILQEWARVGQTQIVNADKVSGPNLTLQLVDTPERDALDILLRSASGYIAAPRTTPALNAAMYDRITIFMSTTKAPAQVATAAPPPTFQRPPQPDDSDEPINVQMPQPMNPGMYPVAGQPGLQPMPGMQPQPQPIGQQPQQLPAQPGSSPVPGQLLTKPGVMPPPQQMPPAMPNPYQPVQRPGGPGGPGGGEL